MMDLFLGRTGAGHLLTWKDPANQHISVLGRSGSGKSYFLRGLLEQAGRGGASCIVLDYSSDFSSYVAPADIACRVLDVGDENFSLNPLACVSEVGAEMCAQRLQSAIHAVFRLGPKGSLALRRVTLEYLKGCSKPTLAGLVQHLDGIQLSVGLEAAMEPLDLLASLLPAGNGHIGIDLDAPGVTIVEFSRFQDARIRALLIDLILTALWDSWTAEGQHERPLILLLDEAQNLNWGTGSVAARILREGRKYGMAGWFASQWIDNKTADSALAQAALQAHFRPDDANITQLAGRLGGGDTKKAAHWRRLISALRVGQYVLCRASGDAVILTAPSRQG